VNPCARPLDPLDAEAIASGAEPVYARDASEHARVCPSCGQAVSEAALLSLEIDSLGGLRDGQFPAIRDGGPDLAGGVLRLRPFSRRERRDLGLWKGPCLFAAFLFFSGFLVLALPGISASEQAGLAAAALAPLFALLRAGSRSLAELASAWPAGLDALGQAMRREQTLGFVCLFVLAPVLFAFRRALARERRR
jgi:hypothetical protein